MAPGRKDVTVTRTNGGADIFRLAGPFGDDNLIRHQGLVWWTGFEQLERIVNFRPPQVTLWQFCVRAAKPWRNPTEWSGAQALSSKPPAASARILIIRFSGSIAFRRPAVADVFIVGLVPADRVVSELEMRHDLAVVENRRAGDWGQSTRARRGYSRESRPTLVQNRRDRGKGPVDGNPPDEGREIVGLP
jgi:hypothetical protein